MPEAGPAAVAGPFHNPENDFHNAAFVHVALRKNFSIQEIIFRIEKNTFEVVDLQGKYLSLV